MRDYLSHWNSTFLIGKNNIVRIRFFRALELLLTNIRKIDSDGIY